MSQIFNQPQATNQWKIDEINVAVKEAQASNFADVVEVHAVINNWKVDDGTVWNSKNRQKRRRR